MALCHAWEEELQGLVGKQKPALFCSVGIRGEIWVIKEEKLHSWHYICLCLHPETLPTDPHTPCPLPRHPASLFSLGLWELWSLDPKALSQRLATHTHTLSWQVCSRVSRELGSLGLSLKKSDLGSTTAPDPGDKYVCVTDKHQIRESRAYFSHR